MGIMKKYKYAGTEMRINHLWVGHVYELITISENKVILSRGVSDDGPKSSVWKTVSDHSGIVISCFHEDNHSFNKDRPLGETSDM